MNAAAYAEVRRGRVDMEALVRCGDEMLDVLVQRVGMKEGSALMLRAASPRTRRSRSSSCSTAFTRRGAGASRWASL